LRVFHGLHFRLTMPELSRAGPAILVNRHHRDELRRPPGNGSGDLVRPLVNDD
jgi:hypothetical protein